MVAGKRMLTRWQGTNMEVKPIHTVTGIASNIGGWPLKCHWTCSCGCNRSERTDNDLEVWAYQRLKNAHPGFGWIGCRLDITRG